MATRSESVPAARSSWRDYLELTKPKVVALIVFTAIVGTLLASQGMPPLDVLIWANLGIACASASAAVINHVLDRRIDEQMGRTRGRPLPTGRLSERRALVFAAVLGIENAHPFGELIGFNGRELLEISAHDSGEMRGRRIGADLGDCR